MHRKAAIKASGLLWAIVGMAASLAALVWFLPSGDRLQTQLWREKLSTASEEQARECLEHLAQLGDAGIPALVEAMGSTQSSVAAQARALVLREIDEWELLSLYQTAPKLALLADSLVEQMPCFDDAARSFAGDLALRIILWPGRQQASNQDHVLAACEQILKSPPRDAASQQTVAAESSGRAAAARDSFTQHILGSSLPGGGLGADPLDPPPSVTPNAADSGHGSKLSQNNAERNPLRGSQSSPGRLSPSPNARPLADEANSTTSRTSVSRDAMATAKPKTAVGGSYNTQAMYMAALTADEASLIHVMRQLHSTDPREVATAEQELRRRGFQNAHLEIAGALTDSDPQVRRQLAENLPNVEGIDTRPWYIWLSRDDDADVRLSAVTFMVTSGDAELLKRVDELARMDTDPRIQQQAARTVQKRR